MTARRRRPNGGGTIYPRKDGRYEGAAWITDPDGIRRRIRRRIRVYGHTWDETNRALAKAIAEHERNGTTTDQRTVAGYLEHWLTIVAPHRVRANTLTQYQQAIRQHIVPALGSRKLAKLTAKDVRTWLSSLATQCRCCTRGLDARRPPQRQRCCALGACCHLTYSPRRLQYLHSVLSVALNHAVREDLLPRNVAHQVQVPTGPPRRFEPLTLPEAHAFLAESRRYPNGELYELALRLGLRRGELVGLRWSDIDYQSRTLTIRRTLQRIKGQGLKVLPTKTETSDRRIPLSRPCIKARKDHARYQQAERERAGNAWYETGYVFTTSIGTPLDPQAVTHGIKALCDRAGVRRIRFHDLRHTRATLLIETGVPLVTVKELLGHSNIAITANIYTHTRLPHQADAISQLDAQLDQTPRRTRRLSASASDDGAEHDKN